MKFPSALRWVSERPAEQSTILNGGTTLNRRAFAREPSSIRPGSLGRLRLLQFLRCSGVDSQSDRSKTSTQRKLGRPSQVPNGVGWFGRIFESE